MWTIPYLVSVLCMQLIPRDKKAILEAESDSVKMWLECEDVAGDAGAGMEGYYQVS